MLTAVGARVHWPDPGPGEGTNSIHFPLPLHAVVHLDLVAELIRLWCFCVNRYHIFWGPMKSEVLVQSRYHSIPPFRSPFERRWASRHRLVVKECYFKYTLSCLRICSNSLVFSPPKAFSLFPHTPTHTSTNTDYAIEKGNVSIYFQ